MNQSKKSVKNTNTWRLNNTLLNIQEITEEIKEEIKKYLETNDNENMMTQNLWDATKAVLRGKFIAIQSYFKKQETGGEEPRWGSRRMCSHSLLQEHQNHNQLDNHQQEDTGTHQKRYATSKDKGEATMRQQEGHNQSKIKSHNLWVGDSQTGEHLYHTSPPTGVKVLSPTSGFPTWGSGNGRRNSQRIRR